MSTLDNELSVASGRLLLKDDTQDYGSRSAIFDSHRQPALYPCQVEVVHALARFVSGKMAVE